MANQPAMEQLAKYKQTMGEELGEAFHFCRQHLFDLTITWDQSETLFGNELRTAVLSRTGGRLAYNIRRHFHGIVVLGIMRLMDPPKTRNKKNLVLKLLPLLCDDSCRNLATPVLQRLDGYSKVLIDARNKILAHNDYDYLTSEGANLSQGSRSQITQIFQTILEFLNIIEFHYSKSRTMIPPMGNHDAILHLHYLDQGLRLKTKIESDVKEGRDSWKEFREIPAWLRIEKNEGERYR